MKHSRTLGFMSGLLFALQFGCMTQPSTPSALQQLQGSWEGHWKVQEEPGGPLVDPSPNQVTITIEGHSLHYPNMKIEDGVLTLVVNQYDPEHPPKSFYPPKDPEEHKSMNRYELRKVQRSPHGH